MTKFFVPDYYDAFRCKGGACRHTCCRGWNISVNMHEYFALRSLPCSESLRGKLDGALSIISDTDRERFAAFVRREDGSCPLLREDGLCALQHECGEEPLPTVCRVYPRSVRCDYAREIALSASCEAVTEALLGSTAPLKFVERDLPGRDAPASAEEADERAVRFTANMRRVCMRMLQNRALPIADRIANLASLFYELHAYEQAGDGEGLCAAAEALSGRKFSPLPIPEADWMHLAAPLTIAGAFIPESPSLGRFWPRITSALHLSEDRAQWSEEQFVRAERRYALLKGRFSDTHSLWQPQWERLVCNYAFYTRLPLSDRLTGLREEALALAACYCLTRFMAVTCVAEKDDPDALVDVVASVMRLIEHSGFDRRCVAILCHSHTDNEDHLRDMLLTV